MTRHIFVIVFFLVSSIAFSQNYSTFSGTITLDIEKKEQLNYSDSSYFILHNITEEATKTITFNNITTREKAIATCKAISELLETKYGITYRETELLSEGLVHHFLDCNYFSIVFYHILKTVHGYNIALITSPGHMFMRWYLPDGTYFNYETTSKTVQEDSDYISMFGISKQALDNKLYMKPLTVNQILATNYVDMANSFPIDSIKRRTELIEKANSLDSLCLLVIYNQATIKYFEKDFNTAITLLKRILSKDSSNYKTYQRIAALYDRKDDFNSAIYYYTKSIQSNPNDPDGYIYRSISYLNVGKVSEAMDDFDLATERLNTLPFFKMLYNYFKMRELEDRIMKEYLKQNGK